MIIKCAYCNKEPHEIEEYKEAADCGLSPNQYVQREEGTYNCENGYFACTSCYIKIGMPSSARGWIAP